MHQRLQGGENVTLKIDGFVFERSGFLKAIQVFEIDVCPSPKTDNFSAGQTKLEELIVLLTHNFWVLNCSI
jgi:hypothetical protein